MANTNALARTLHDSGVAAWFGGSLMGAVGLNGAAACPGRRPDAAGSGRKRRVSPVDAGEPVRNRSAPCGRLHAYVGE